MSDPFGEFERAGWSAGRAEPYHHAIGAITREPIPRLLDAAGVGAGIRLLDVATGPGYAVAAAAARGAAATGVDFSAEMVALAQRLHPDAEFAQADAQALLNDFNLSYPNGPDANNRINIEYGLFGLPETFFIRADGTLLYRHSGPLTQEVMNEQMRALLESS